VDEAWKAREEKRFNKLKTTHQKNCILIGNDQQYKRITLLYPIDELLKTLQGKKALKELVAKHKNQLRPGEKILNTNIPSEIL
jgi:hypothetical protein